MMIIMTAMAGTGKILSDRDPDAFFFFFAVNARASTRVTFLHAEL
jgi:hypothetical protein